MCALFYGVLFFIPCARVCVCDCVCLLHYQWQLGHCIQATIKHTYVGFIPSHFSMNLALHNNALLMLHYLWNLTADIDIRICECACMRVCVCVCSCVRISMSIGPNKHDACKHSSHSLSYQQDSQRTFQLHIHTLYFRPNPAQDTVT